MKFKNNYVIKIIGEEINRFFTTRRHQVKIKLKCSHLATHGFFLACLMRM